MFRPALDLVFLFSQQKKKAKSSSKLEPDFLGIVVLISLAVAQNSSHMIFLKKSAPDLS